MGKIGLRLSSGLLANEDAGSVVEGKKSEKPQTELQTGRKISPRLRQGND